MLTRWTLENFKPIRGRIDLRLAPLTVLAGLNSSGKSSFLQSILLVSQTLANQKHDEPLILNGTFLRLGTFADVLNERASEPRIGIGFTLTGSVERPDEDNAATIDMNVRFEAARRTKESFAAIEGARVVLTEGDLMLNPSTHMEIRRSPAEEWRAQEVVEELPERRKQQRSHQQFPVDVNPHIARIKMGTAESTEVLAFVPLLHFLPQSNFQPMGASVLLTDLLLTTTIQFLITRAALQIIRTFADAIRYVGPLRAEPQSIQSFSPSGQPDDVGPKGEYAAAVYAANRQQQIDYWHPETGKIEHASLEQAMDVWLRYLGIADHVSTREAAVPGVSWLIRSSPKTTDRPLHAVGVGVSQVLPILVSGLLCPPGTILIIEQPELHLHERPQARLGDFFFGLTQVGKQVLVETHSAVLISQLRFRMVRDGQTARDAITIYFVEQDEHGDTGVLPIEISPRGAIENWPDGFFDESFRQEDRITQAGILTRGGRKNA